MPTCPQCGEENPEGFKFCGSCGALLAEASAPREVRKTVTVVFSDVTGSTALGERLDPESLRRVMGRYFDEMQAVVERHGGTVEKFIGDAVMAVFGIPVLHEDDAVRAVRAAAEMRERLAGLNEELERDWGVTIAVRTGVNTGEVVAGDASSGGQRFATGDAVNVAKRLEEAAPPNEILLGETTHRLVRDAVKVEAVEPLELKGKGERVSAYRLLSIEPGAEGRARRLDSPMVGREREQALLERAYERAAGERGCHLFTVLGAAGVGKSRLLAEFLKGLGDNATVVGGRCLPYGEGITFWPLLEVLRKLYGDELVSAIETRLAGDENAELIASRVGAAVGLAESAGATEETFWAVRKLLEAQAHEQPLVLVFDDLQWGQPTFLDLVEHIADWSRDAPILLICLARPEFLDDRPGWGGGKFNATSVLLEPLSDEDSAELVLNLLGQSRPRRRRAGPDHGCRRGQPALRRGDARDAHRRRAPRTFERRLGALRRLRVGRRPADDSGAPRSTARPPGLERASRHRAGLGRGQGVPPRRSRRALADRGAPGASAVTFRPSFGRSSSVRTPRPFPARTHSGSGTS